MKKIILIVTLMSFAMFSYAQDFVDNALLFSRVKPGGSARIQALGGTQVSLGGDYSSALSNPAGLGMFNKSEFTISPAINFYNASSEYFGTKTNDVKSVFNIPGLSLVIHQPSDREKGFLGGSIGISLNRTNDFHKNYRYKASNNENSLIDYFISDADGIDPNTMLIQNNNPGSNFYNLTAQAYNNYLIEDFYDSAQATYFYGSELSPLPADPGRGLPAEIRTIDQEEISQSKGTQYQWAISYGANFNDKLFIGAGLGIVSLKYKVNQVFTESNFSYSEDADYKPLNNFKTNETYDIRGSGVNLTLGTIYRATDFLQLGVSFVTPTAYAITDSYTAGISSLWNIYNVSDPSFPNKPDVTSEFDQPLVSEYSLNTPLRLNTGATLISKLGFISGDVEFVNYSKAKYRSEDFGVENDDIKAEYTSVVNYRIGAEGRYQQYRVRGGFNYMTDPMIQKNNIDRSITTFSGGLGYRAKTYYIDLAAVHSKTEGRRIPYFVSGPDPIATQKFNNTNFILTLGFTF